MSKRRWWLAEERFAKVYRRLRRNYSRTLQRGELVHRENEALEREHHKREREIIEARHAVDLARMDERLAELAKEVARARLYFGPTKWGTRYELFVRFEESYVSSAQSIIDTGPMIVQVLCRQIQNALATIDFARVKREDPSRARVRGEVTRMFIDAPTER